MSIISRLLTNILWYQNLSKIRRLWTIIFNYFFFFQNINWKNYVNDIKIMDYYYLWYQKHSIIRWLWTIIVYNIHIIYKGFSFSRKFFFFQNINWKIYVNNIKIMDYYYLLYQKYSISRRLWNMMIIHSQ